MTLRFFAWIGILVCFAWILGLLGVSDFKLLVGPVGAYTCTKATP